jgi:hypothetical protein
LGFDHLAGELVANLFALDMKLPAAQPCVVAVSEEFIDLLPDDTSGLDLVRAFGRYAHKLVTAFIRRRFEVA